MKQNHKLLVLDSLFYIPKNQTSYVAIIPTYLTQSLPIGRLTDTSNIDHCFRHLSSKNGQLFFWIRGELLG